MPTIRDILDIHFARYPLMRAEDVYKLVHQAVFGPGHILADPEAAREELEDDLIRARAGREGPQEDTDPLDPQGRLIRVHLQPLARLGNAAELLLPVMVETARTVRGSAAKMEEWLGEAEVWCMGALPEEHGRLGRVVERFPGAGHRPLHHSAIYRAAYRPAYRVVSSALWEQATASRRL